MHLTSDEPRRGGAPLKAGDGQRAYRGGYIARTGRSL